MESFKEQLRETQLFGCWYTVLLGLGMAFIIFVGTTMGDCNPGPGCHDHDGRLIGLGLLEAAMISLIFGAGVWLLLAAVGLATNSRLSPTLSNWLFGGVVFLLLCLTFSPAMELLLAVRV